MTSPLFQFLDELTLEDGRSYGRNLDTWQREDFETLDTGISGAYLGRSRGHSKTADLGAYGLYHLITTPGARAYAFAVDADQARLVRDSIAGFVRRSPTLRAKVQVFKTFVTIPDLDSTLEIWPADAASSWGLRPSLVILDELSQWRSAAAEELFQATFSATGKVKGCQLLIGTTAHWNRNGLCWRIRELVRESPDWYFSERGQCASWIDPSFLKRQKELLPAHVYEMLHENRWTEAGGEFLTWREIDSVFDDTLTPATDRTEGAKNYFGLDLATSRDRTALAIIRTDGEQVIVENIATWAGSNKERVQLGEVEETVTELAEKFKPKEVVLDPYQGLLMSERLQRKGLRVHEFAFTQPSRAQLFDTVLQLIRQGRLKSFPHDLLKEELSGLRWTEKAGKLRPDHPDSGHDDTVVAVALAATRAVASTIKRKTGVKMRVVGSYNEGRFGRGMKESLGV